MTDFLFICVCLKQYFNGELFIEKKAWNICLEPFFSRHVSIMPRSYGIFSTIFYYFLAFFFINSNINLQLLLVFIPQFMHRFLFYSYIPYILWLGGNFVKWKILLKNILICNSIHHLICIRYIIFKIYSHYFLFFATITWQLIWVDFLLGIAVCLSYF